MLTRILDESYPSETRRHVVAVTVARLNANACFRFAPPFLASISDDFSTSLGRIGFALMFTELVMIVSPFVGSVVDRLDRRSAMVGGLLGVSAATTLAAASPNVPLFVIGIAILGLSKLVFDIGLSAWVNDHVDYERRGRVIGITETSWALGLLVGVTIMGLVASATDWRWGYAVGAGGTAFMALYLSRRMVRETHARHENRSNAREPIPRRGWLVVAAMFFLMAASQCVFVTFGSWLDDEFGFTEAGIAAVAFGLGAFELFASVTSARRTDVWGKERSVALGAGLIVPAGVALAVLDTSRVGGIVALAVYLLGFEFAIVSLLPVGANLVPSAPGRGLGLALGGGTLGRAVMSLTATAAYDARGIAAPAIIGSVCAAATVSLVTAHRRSVSRGIRS